MSRSQASTIEENPTPPPTAEPETPEATGPATASMPGWLPTEDQPPTTSGPSGDLQGDELDDGPLFESEPPPRAGTDRPSRASTDPGIFLGLAEAVVGMTSLAVRWVRARRRPYLPEHAWLADEQDVEAMAPPLSRIVARRSPITGEGSEDVADGIELMLGAANYALKGVGTEAQAEGAANLEEPEQAS